MNTLRNLAWAAGIFEGEGCITVTRTVRGDRIYKSLKLNVTMVDEDVMNDFARAMGIGHITYRHSPSQASSGRQPVYTWQVSARMARDAIGLLMPYLSKRRIERLNAAFAEIADAKAVLEARR